MTNRHRSSFAVASSSEVPRTVAMSRRALALGPTLVALLVGVVATTGCSDDKNNTTTTGTAGSGGSGGSSSTGGAAGSSGSGGASGSGGTAGSGGSAGGDAGTCTNTASKAGEAKFKRHTVDPMLAGPAYASVADMNKDGKPDLVVSSFGTIMGNIPAGQLRIYAQGANLDTWTPTTIIPESDAIKFPNQTSVVDMDGDGDLDILLPSGFFPCNITFVPNNTPCGGVRWYEQTANGWTRHNIVEGDNRFYHEAVLVDMDADGTKDLVTVREELPAAGVGMSTANTIWFKGIATGDRFQTTYQDLGVGLGGFLRPRDIDHDGDIDFASAEFEMAGESFAWKENKGATWEHHVFNSDSGAAIQMSFVENLYGDGVLHAIGSNHTNTAKATPDLVESAVFVFDIPADPKQPWVKHKISEGIVSIPGSAMSAQFAPGIFGTGDIDGDCDIDIVVSGDGDPNVYWLEQTGKETWKTHILQDGLEQAGGTIITDLNGDGKNEIVITGYIDNVVYVYEREP